jgi:pyruvate/2-oxoglutarate/acetoin dehydrogenase E1 component
VSRPSTRTSFSASIDRDTIGQSIRKTNSVLLVGQGAPGTSYGGWLADEIQRRYFDYLDQPIERVTGGEASPVSRSCSSARRLHGPKRLS